MIIMIDSSERTNGVAEVSLRAESQGQLSNPRHLKVTRHLCAQFGVGKDYRY